MDQIKTYDFSKGKRGRIVKNDDPVESGKVEISVVLDQDILDHFMRKSDAHGGSVGYQTLINETLRKAIEAPELYEIVRKAVRDEFSLHSSA